MATIASIQKLLSRDDCEKILRRSLDSPAQLISYKLTKFSDDVAGFLGDHLYLTIKFTSGNATTQTAFFMKTLPQFNLNQLDYVEESGVFKKEVLLYQNLLPELLKTSRFGPRCYFIKNNCIVLEDLKVKGFDMLPRHGYMSEKYCLGMLKTLAKFHASSLIYEKKRGVRIDEKFPEEIKESCFSFIEGAPRQKWCVNSIKCVTDVIKLLVEDPNRDEICDKLRRFVFEDMPVLIKPSERFRNVLTHDDLWCNNMLFNDRAECVFVDFQMSRYTPPAVDFLLSLYVNLEPSYVETNLGRYVDFYYSSLEQELEKNNLDNSELPKTEFLKTLQHYKLMALTEVVMYGTHVYISEDLANQIVSDFNNYNEFSFINRSKFAIKEIRDNPQYRDRLTGVVAVLVKTLAHK